MIFELYFSAQIIFLTWALFKSKPNIIYTFKFDFWKKNFININKVSLFLIRSSSCDLVQPI